MRQSHFARYRQTATSAGTVADPADRTGPGLAKEARVLPEGAATAGILLAVWILLVAVSAIDKANFLSRETLLSVTFTMAVLGVLTVGESLVTISGGVLDLSIPTALILPAWVMATLLVDGTNVWLTIAIGLLVGIAWGASTRPSSSSAS